MCNILYYARFHIFVRVQSDTCSVRVIRVVKRPFIVCRLARLQGKEGFTVNTVPCIFIGWTIVMRMNQTNNYTTKVNLAAGEKV